MNKANGSDEGGKSDRASGGNGSGEARGVEVPALLRGIRAGQSNADAVAAATISCSLESRVHAEAIIETAIHRF